MKMIKVLVALLVVVGMVVPAIAEDRLSLSGEMRVRGWTVDAGGDTTKTWADQRLRVGGNIAVAEGVSITFRTDITESNWGNSDGTFSPVQGNGIGSGRSGAAQQWDRAHINLDLSPVSLSIGQIYAGFSGSQVVNSQDNGFKFTTKTAVPVSGFFFVDNDGTAPDGVKITADTQVIIDAAGDIAAEVAACVPGNVCSVTIPGVSFATAQGKDKSDAFLYGIGVSPAGQNYKSDIFFSGYTNGGDMDIYLVGADISLAMEALKFAAELDIFGGDASASTDAVGTQLLLDASMAASSAATIGGQIYYALSADSGEKQIQYLGNDFNGWDPIMDVGTSLSNEAIIYGRPFDFTGDGAGVIGGRLYGKFKASDSVGLGASVAYLTPEDDKYTDVDSQTALAVGLTYALMANTSLQAQVQYVDTDDKAGTDALTQAGVGIFVNF